MASLRFIRNLSLETKKWNKNIDKSIDTNIETNIDKNSVKHSVDISSYKKTNKCITPITPQKNKNIVENHKYKYTYDKNILLYILFCCGGVGSAGFGVSMVYGYILYDDISTLFL